MVDWALKINYLSIYLLTLPYIINETLKWLTSLAHLNAEMHSGGETVWRLYISSLSPPTVGTTRDHCGGDSVAVRYQFPLPSPLLLSVPLL